MDLVLERSLSAFWMRGFEGASIRDLVEATGLKAQSLYNAFGDKRGLFLAALARYRAHVSESLTPLGAPGAGLAELSQYLETFLSVLRAQGVSACLLVKTAFGEQTSDPEIRALVTASGAAVRAAFSAVIAASVARGEARADLDPKHAAAYLFTVLHGLSALSHTGGTSADVQASIVETFGALRAPCKRPSKRPSKRSSNRQRRTT